VSAGADDGLRASTGDAEVVRAVFEELPLLLAGLEGAEHTFVAANAVYPGFVGRPAFIGVPLREVLPEVAGQQVFEMFDRVCASGEPQISREWRVQLHRDATGTVEETYVLASAGVQPCT